MARGYFLGMQRPPLAGRRWAKADRPQCIKWMRLGRLYLLYRSSSKDRQISGLDAVAGFYVRGIAGCRPELHDVCDRPCEAVKLVGRNRVQFCLKVKQSHG